MRYKDIRWDSESERQLFLQETTELIDLLEEAALESAPDVQNVFRAAHTLKGSAGMVGLDQWVSITHAVEDGIDRVRNGQLSFEEVREHILVLVDTVRSDINGTSLSLEQKISVRIQVTLDEGVPMPGVRAFQVFQCFEEWGHIVSSDPPLDSVSQFEGSVITAELEGSGSLDELLAAVRALPDIDRAETQKREEPEGVPEAGVIAKRDETIRIQATMLEQFLEGLGELLLRHAQLSHVLGNPGADVRDALDRMKRIAMSLQDTTLRARMLPLETLFRQYPRAVHDIAKKLDKSIRLEMSGQETELDRLVMDRLHEPLLHLIRNACDHGIESPKERLNRQKPAEGTLWLSASTEQGRVHIILEDDGQGISWDKLRQKVIEQGLASQDEARTLGPEQLTPYLFQSGVSTKTEVSDLSGRGVGLDAVKSALDQLHGAIHVESTEGQGTRFILELPMSMAILSILLVQVGSLRLGVPVLTVDRIEQNETAFWDHPLGRDLIEDQGRPYPVFRLKDIFGEITDSDTILVRIVDGNLHCAVTVDRVLGQQDVVVKPVERLLPYAPWLTGTAILGDGGIALIADLKRLLSEYTSEDSETARPQETHSLSTEAQIEAFLVFRLSDGQLYGISLQHVREVLPHGPMTIIAQQHPWILGWTRVREETLPVIGLNSVLQIPEEANTGNFVVTRLSGLTQALHINEVVEISPIPWTAIESIPEEYGRQSVDVVVGLVHHRLGTIQVLDLDYIVSQVGGRDQHASKPHALPRLSGVVWVADDSRFARERIVGGLEEMGCTVQDFVDGQDLWDAYTTAGSMPDLILADIEMPRMDGYELTRRIKESRSDPQVKVLVHSSIEGSWHEERAQSAGADAVLRKWDLPALFSMVANLLERPPVLSGKTS